MKRLLTIVTLIIAALAIAGSPSPAAAGVTVWDRPLMQSTSHSFYCRTYGRHMSTYGLWWRSAKNGCSVRLVRLYAFDPEIQQLSLIACLDPGEPFFSGYFNEVVIGRAWSRC